jgi:hypothetical protein
MQQAAIEQAFHQWLYAADFNQFRHQVFAARFDIGQHRDICPDACEIVQFEIDAGFLCHCEKM